MTRAITLFLSEGHRLLVTSKHTPAEIARLTKRDPRRVSEWRAGRSVPNTADRAALEQARIARASTWDQPPKTTSAASSSNAKSRSTLAEKASPVDTESDDALDTLGLSGLAMLARQIGELAPSLPPKDRLIAFDRRAKILAQHERLRQSATDAREEYFASSEFRRDVELLADAIPEAAQEIRARVARLGVVLPPPAPPIASSAGAGSNVDEFVTELRAARQLREIGEERLARSHVRGLAIDVGKIAAQLLRQPKRLTQVLELLDDADGFALRSALEREMAIRDVCGLDIVARTKIAELARQLGHDDVADAIGAGDAG